MDKVLTIKTMYKRDRRTGRRSDMQVVMQAGWQAELKKHVHSWTEFTDHFFILQNISDKNFRSFVLIYKLSWNMIIETKIWAKSGMI